MFWLLIALGILKIPVIRPNRWYLAMNFNPSDEHIMQYCHELWESDTSYGTKQTSLTKDYIDKMARNIPADYIAIVRHNSGIANAVKIWQFKGVRKTLRERFQVENTNGSIATTGNHIYDRLSTTGTNIQDDPIFSVDGGLILSFRYSNNGCRITLENSDDFTDPPEDGINGIGVHTSIKSGCGTRRECYYEVSAYQDCSYDKETEKPTCGAYKAIGTDYADGYRQVQLAYSYILSYLFEDMFLVKREDLCTSIDLYKFSIRFLKLKT